ncbi:MAG: YlxM family DNA-binding protein [Clostridiales bacterium]|nr:YlxM family DNA-binding protein [Clostridiales bacterium]
MRSVDECMLMDFYGNLLTEKMRNTMELYLDDDLSLSEIADSENISRQGVHDTINRARKQLQNYEEKLGLVERFSSQLALIDEAIKLIDEDDAEGAKALLMALKTEI